MEPYLEPTDPPGAARTLSYWLVALLLGSGLAGLANVVRRLDDLTSGQPHYTVSGLLGLGSVLFVAAALFSLPALLLLLLLVPQVLAASTRRGRWLRLLALQATTSFSTCLLVQLVLVPGMQSRVVWVVGLCYFAGGLPAAWWRFWSWLRW